MNYGVGHGASASGRCRRWSLVAGALTALAATGCGQNRPAEALRTSYVSDTAGEHSPTGTPNRLALVEVGDAVVFIGLVEGAIPAMDPPPLRGRDFKVDC